MKNFVPTFEMLEVRENPSITSFFSAGVLSVAGDHAANKISVTADAGGNLLVNGNTVAGATRNSVALITVDGGAGNDTIIIDKSVDTRDANGVLVRSPDTQLYGGDGNDTLLPQNGGIVGGLAGVINGVVVGPVVGNSVAFGGRGDDIFISGPGNDQFYGGQGDDTYVWPPGTLTDIFDGGSGKDTATIIGNDNANDIFVLGAGPDGSALFQRTNLVNFSVFMKNVETVNLRPGTGSDQVFVNSLKGTDVVNVNVFTNDFVAADVVSITGTIGVKTNIIADPFDTVTFA